MALLLIGFGAWGCGETPAPSPDVTLPAIFLPVRQTDEPSMMARAEGTLQLHNGCVWLRQGGDEHLIVWPRGTTIAQNGTTIDIVDAEGRFQASIGDHVVLFGGEETGLLSTGDVEKRIGGPIPLVCRTQTYWIGGVSARL